MFTYYAQTKKPRFGGQLNTLNLVKSTSMNVENGFILGRFSVLDEFSKIKQSYQKKSLAYQFSQLQER